MDYDDNPLDTAMNRTKPLTTRNEAKTYKEAREEANAVTKQISTNINNTAKQLNQSSNIPHSSSQFVNKKEKVIKINQINPQNGQGKIKWSTKKFF